MAVALAVLFCATALLALTVTSPSSAPRDWPPFLRASDEYPAQIASAVRRLWLEATFTRTALGGDRYEADDGARTRGVYHVLVREGAWRVILSWGTHHGSILGTIGGSALTRLEFADDADRAAQRLVVNAIIDNGLAAGLTRPILLLFGGFVDRKLTEAFRTASAAAAWAHANPDEFCAWLAGAVTGDRRAELRDVFDECVEADRDQRTTLSHRSRRSSPRIQ